jgi:two-component system response regulator FixJ
MGTPDELTVHIVDDQQQIRELVSSILDTVGLLCVQWDQPSALLSSFSRHKIDVLVVDVRLVGMSGLELVRQLRERGLRAPVVFISGVSEVPVAVEAMKLGAHDFLQKPFTAQALIDAVQAAHTQHHQRAGREAQVARARAQVAKLSPREREVFLAVVAGKPNKVTASEMNLSEKTVEEHRRHVMTKLAVASLADLVKLAVLAGLCDPADVAHLS